MSVFRAKNETPQVYTSESRDFQILLRVLDFVQNSIKYDIDSITDIIDTDDISGYYLDRLKNKLGFFTNNSYDDNTLRIALNAFPYMIRYKGSIEGVERCVNTFLNIIGVRDGCRIEVINDRNDPYNTYILRIGLKSRVQNITILKDMLSYILPTGYFVEIYFYQEVDTAVLNLTSSSNVLHISEEALNYVRSDKIEDIEDANNELRKDTLGVVHVSIVSNPSMVSISTTVKEDEKNESI